MGLTSAQLDVVDLTPRIGSEIRTDLDTLLSGREAANIRETLEQRGVVFVRGLDISDEQQVAIAKTLGNLVQNEGESGIYKISLDKNVNQKADYLKGSMFWHFDGSLQPYPNLATLLRAINLSDSGGETEFCNTYAAYDDLPQSDKDLIADLRVVHSAERSQYYVRPEMSYEETLVVAEVPDQGLPDRVDASVGPQVVTPRRDSGLRDRATRRGEPRVARASARLVHPAEVRLSPRVAARRPSDLGQHRHDAPGTRVPGRQRSSDAPHDPRGRRAPAVKLGIATPVVTNVSGAALTWERDATIEDIGRVAETADRLGYHHLTCSEHIGMPASEAGRRGARYWDPLATLGYISARTEQIRLATMTLVLGYHHPLAIVKRYGTLDHVSKGRVILGVGVGSLREEFDLLGAPFDDRGARGDDALRALRVALPTNEPAYEGEFYSFGGLTVDPCALQPHMPIWVGGRTKRSLRRALTLADGWCPFGVSIETAAEWLKARDVPSDFEVGSAAGQAARPGGKA